MRFSYLLIISLAASACKTQTNQAKVKAIVSTEQARLANDLVRNIDYLSFSYIDDGCYARQLYMALELASAQIPSSSLYIHGTLNPNDRVSWNYHVAPLIVTADGAGNQSDWILDPGFQEQPLLVDDWIAKSTAVAGSTVTTSYYTPGSDYGRRKQTPISDRTQFISTFEQMPSFQAGDMLAACARIYHYLANEAGTNVEQKRTKLISQTTYLANKMREMSEYEPSLPSDFTDSIATSDDIKQCYSAFQK